MTTATVRTLWILAGLAFAIFLASSWTRLVDSAIEDRYGRDLRRTQALDAELDEHVMKCRTGLATSYDPFVQTLAELRRLNRALEQVPRLVSAEGRAEVLERRAAWADSLRQKETLIDSFKTKNSVLRNSLRFFPTAARGLADKLAAQPDGGKLGALIEDLVGEVLVYNLLPDREVLPRANRAIAALDAAGASLTDKPTADELGILLMHARTILDRKPSVDALMDQILALPVAARASEMDMSYSRRYGAAIDAAATRRLLLSLLAMAVLVFGAADIILHLRRSATALREVSREVQLANAALEVEREKEKELGELKSRFVSIASHEFRAPLTIILSSAELLEAYGDRWTAPKKRENFSRIQTAVANMKALLDAVLVVGQAEAGKLEYKPVPGDVPAFCADLVEGLNQSAGDVRIEHSLKGDWDGAEVDERLLSQILTNLLSNGIKYSKPGGVVEFAVSREGAQAVFEVGDHGIGIPLEDQPRLFESFARATNVGGIAGTGLGLAIVKKSVERCGGSVSFESRPGEGTRFMVRMPCWGAE